MCLLYIVDNSSVSIFQLIPRILYKPDTFDALSSCGINAINYCEFEAHSCKFIDAVANMFLASV